MLLNVTHDRKFQRYLDKMEQQLHVAMVPVLMATAKRALSEGTIPAQTYIHKRGHKVLYAHYKRIFRDMYGSISDPAAAKARNPDAEGVNAFMAKVNEYLDREAATKIADIGLSLVEDIREKLVSGMNEGLAVNAIASDIYDDIPDMSQGRAARIARTETHNASLWATDETFQDKEIEIKTKTWWSAQDNRVRESHRAMHGVTIPADQPFETDDGDMMYPGDDSLGADPGGIVNCRCAVLYNTETQPSDEGNGGEDTGEE